MERTGEGGTADSGRRQAWVYPTKPAARPGRAHNGLPLAGAARRMLHGTPPSKPPSTHQHADRVQGSPAARLVKSSPTVQETPRGFLGEEDPLEKGQATHSSVLGLPGG